MDSVTGPAKSRKEVAQFRLANIRRNPIHMYSVLHQFPVFLPSRITPSTPRLSSHLSFTREYMFPPRHLIPSPFTSFLHFTSSSRHDAVHSDVATFSPLRSLLHLDVLGINDLLPWMLKLTPVIEAAIHFLLLHFRRVEHLPM